MEIKCKKLTKQELTEFNYEVEIQGLKIIILKQSRYINEPNNSFNYIYSLLSKRSKKAYYNKVKEDVMREKELKDCIKYKDQTIKK